MRLTHVFRSLASGFVLYVVMAACGASDNIVASMSDGGDVGDALVDALGDALVNPVGDAKADPLPPDVATESCTKVLKFGGVDSYVAEHAYPGKTAAELSLVQTVIASTALEGYTMQVSVGHYVRDGFVAQYCGAVSGGTAISSGKVTFVLAR